MGSSSSQFSPSSSFWFEDSCWLSAWDLASFSSFSFLILSSIAITWKPIHEAFKIRHGFHINDRKTHFTIGWIANVSSTDSRNSRSFKWHSTQGLGRVMSLLKCYYSHLTMVSDINEMQGNPSKSSPILSRNKRIIDTIWSSEQIALVFSLGYHNHLQNGLYDHFFFSSKGKNSNISPDLICL